MPAKKVRVLISKLGLDGHDRGAKLVAHTLREAGMEVLYLGIRHTLPEVVETAQRENVDYLGLSFLSGDHMTLVPQVIRALGEKNADHIRLVVGGIILKDHVPELLSMGVRKVFLPGTPLREIADYITKDSRLRHA